MITPIYYKCINSNPVLLICFTPQVVYIMFDKISKQHNNTINIFGKISDHHNNIIISLDHITNIQVHNYILGSISLF